MLQDGDRPRLVLKKENVPGELWELLRRAGGSGEVSSGDGSRSLWVYGRVEAAGEPGAGEWKLSNVYRVAEKEPEV